jgi:copper transport protein
VAVVLLVLGLASPAAAHAALLSSDPADGSVLERQPEAISLQFTERVTVQPDGIRVVDASGDRIDRGAASAEGATATSPLRDDLPDGTYVVSWRVVSADGHPVRGAFTFSVGEETAVDPGLADAAFAGGSDLLYEWITGILRFIAYVGALGAAGAVALRALVHRDGDPPPVLGWVPAAAGAALAAGLVHLPAQAALATGEGWLAVTDGAVLRQVLGDGVWQSLLVTSIGLLALLVTTGLPWSGPTRPLALAGVVLAPVGFALTGHTRSMEPAVAAYVADGAHLLAGAAWFGGLVALVGIVRERRGQDEALGAAEAVVRFGSLAAASVAVVALTGATLSWVEVGSASALTSTDYGRLLLVKVALVAVVVGLAAWNRFRLVPHVAAAALAASTEGLEGDGGGPGEPAWRRLTSVVRAEALVLVVVLAVTSALVVTTPAKTAAVDGPVTVTAPLGEGTVELTVDPARPGRNDVHAYLFDETGRPDDRFEDAAMRLELPAQALGPFDLEPVRVGPGHFQLVAADLPVGGDWEITVTVKPDRFTEQSATLGVPIR